MKTIWSTLKEWELFFFKPQSRLSWKTSLKYLSYNPFPQTYKAKLGTVWIGVFLVDGSRFPILPDPTRIFWKNDGFVCLKQRTLSDLSPQLLPLSFSELTLANIVGNFSVCWPLFWYQTSHPPPRDQSSPSPPPNFSDSSTRSLLTCSVDLLLPGSRWRRTNHHTCPIVNLAPAIFNSFTVCSVLRAPLGPGSSATPQPPSPSPLPFPVLTSLFPYLPTSVFGPWLQGTPSRGLRLMSE